MHERGLLHICQGRAAKRALSMRHDFALCSNILASQSHKASTFPVENVKLGFQANLHPAFSTARHFYTLLSIGILYPFVHSHRLLHTSVGASHGLLPGASTSFEGQDRPRRSAGSCAAAPSITKHIFIPIAKPSPIARLHSKESSRH